MEFKRFKAVKSDAYNYTFDRATGEFVRWGRTLEDDPSMAPLPEIADIEISTICNGPTGKKPCSWCYKSNTGVGRNMDFDTFKKIFHKLGKNLTQIAFGIGDIGANPDFYRIMEYCRNNDYNYVVPNVTINGYNLTDEHADKLAALCGAVAVSHYGSELCYDAVKKLTDRGMTQVNIHKLLCRETYESCFQLMNDIGTDPRLAKLNAVVFLFMKPKGDRNVFHKLDSFKDYRRLIDYALEHNIRFGFDSCTAPAFLEAVKDHPNYRMFESLSEPCESDLFSIYINVDGKAFHCSFTEDEEGWKGVDVLGCDDFARDVWHAEETCRFRSKLLGTAEGKRCRSCPIFDLSMKE